MKTFFLAFMLGFVCGVVAQYVFNSLELDPDPLDCIELEECIFFNESAPPRKGMVRI
jgi:hypothetical protein